MFDKLSYPIYHIYLSTKSSNDNTPWSAELKSSLLFYPEQVRYGINKIILIQVCGSPVAQCLALCVWGVAD